MRRLSSQTLNGKAFEYALLQEFEFKLKRLTEVRMIPSPAITYAKECFDSFDEDRQGLFSLTASFAVNFLIDLEPRLSNRLDKVDNLEVGILGDREGIQGDVRDVIMIRSLQDWEIGISAKNNHRAVKHSRLSKQGDFGKKWMGIPCSENYFKRIAPVFDFLTNLRDESSNKALWSSIENLHSQVYMPVLDAFRDELNRLVQQEGAAAKLIEYLVGTKDYYKVIRLEGEAVEIQAYNLHGSLSKPFKHIKPKLAIPKIKLPNHVLDIQYKQDSQTTLLLQFDNNWVLSFRLHNASSRVEGSLKFDINLENSPSVMFTNQLTVW